MDKHVWRFSIENIDESSIPSNEEFIRFLLNSLLDFVVLTEEGRVANIDGFRYVKDIDDIAMNILLNNDNNAKKEAIL